MALGDFDCTALCDLLEASVDDLYRDLTARLKKYGYAVTVVQPDGYVIGIPKKATTPVALVAHMDTINRHRGVKLAAKDYGKIPDIDLTIENILGVLGADDRAGIYAICELLKLNHRPIVVFTDKEEAGCVGARLLTENDALAGKLDEVKLFIEIDRQSGDDYVYYTDVCPEAVKDFVERHGYKEAVGSCSDVMVLTQKYAVPHVNVGAGYYHQHTPQEQLVCRELHTTVCRVANMLNDAAELPLIRLTPDEIERVYIGRGHWPSLYGGHTYSSWSEWDDTGWERGADNVWRFTGPPRPESKPKKKAEPLVWCELCRESRYLNHVTRHRRREGVYRAKLTCLGCGKGLQGTARVYCPACTDTRSRISLPDEGEPCPACQAVGIFEVRACACPDDPKGLERDFTAAEINREWGQVLAGLPSYTIWAYCPREYLALRMGTHAERRAK